MKFTKLYKTMKLEFVLTSGGWMFLCSWQLSAWALLFLFHLPYLCLNVLIKVVLIKKFIAVPKKEWYSVVCLSLRDGLTTEWDGRCSYKFWVTFISSNWYNLVVRLCFSIFISLLMQGVIDKIWVHAFL